MSKQEFLAQLKVKLSGLPKAEVEEHLAFYSEMIDDRMEEGQTEEDALSDIGSVDDIAKQIIADIPLIKIAKERMTPKRRLKVWEVVLLALGSPIWLSLGVAAIAVLLSLYIALCAVVVSVWAAFVSLVGCGVGGVIGGILLAATGNAPAGGFLIGAGFVSAGLAVLLFFGCKSATKSIFWLTKKYVLSIKKCLIKKENTL